MLVATATLLEALQDVLVTVADNSGKQLESFCLRWAHDVGSGLFRLEVWRLCSGWLSFHAEQVG